MFHLNFKKEIIVFSKYGKISVYITEIYKVFLKLNLSSSLLFIQKI